MNKEIRNLKLILLAIDAVEAKASASNIQQAENIDNLYTCLKTQAKALIENFELDAQTTENA